MLVRQVLDVFQIPLASQRGEDSHVWLLVNDQHDRHGYLCVNFKEHPAFWELVDPDMPTEKQQARAAELLAADNTMQDFSKRPHIEDASLALQTLYDAMESAEAAIYFDLEENRAWDNLSLTREEYEKQIDEDIEKFGLDGIVCKYNTGETEALYTCYGSFLYHFSKPGGKEIEDSAHRKERQDMPSVSASNDASLVSITFPPVVFQRDEAYPFKLCKIVDRNEQGSPYVSYVVIRNGRDEALFTAHGETAMDHAYFSALDYIANAYYEDPALSLEYFAGGEYIKLYYEIAFFSNPPTRLQHNPMALDAHWKAFPGYSTEKVFGEALINGEISSSIRKEIETDFNASLENANLHLDTEMISQLNTQPPISEVRTLDSAVEIASTPLYAAAQYEWEKERTRKIFESTAQEMLLYLEALDGAMKQYEPTRASLERFSDVLHDLYYAEEDKWKEIGASASLLGEPSQDIESFYRSCHKAFTAYKQMMKQEQRPALPG